MTRRGVISAEWLALVTALLDVLGGCPLMVGCQPDMEPIERSANLMIKEVVRPAIEKAADELTTRTSQYQGQGSLINPGYRVRGHGVWGTGVLFDFELNAVGLSANIAGATQQDAGQPASVDPPVERDSVPPPGG
jgi:hypothetical protein